MRQMRPDTKTSALVGLLLVTACSTSPVQTLNEIAYGTLGAAGGTLRSTDGALALTFAAGALASDTQLSIEIDRASNNFASPVYRLGPTGLALASPVEVEVAVVVGVVGPFTLARVQGTQLAMVPGASYDGQRRSVRAQLSLLADYAVVSMEEDGGTPDDCTAPNQGPGPTPPGNDGGIAAGSSWHFCEVSEIEPNDTIHTAQDTQLTLNGGVEINNTVDATLDTFSFTVPSGTHANLIAETYDENVDCPTSTDLDLETRLLGANGQVMAARTAGFFRCGAVDFEANPEARRLGPGTYYLQVLHDGAAPAGRKYKLRVWLIETP